MAEMIMAMVRGTAPEKGAVEAVKGISREELIGILEDALRAMEE